MFKKHAILKILAILIAAGSLAANIVVVSLVFSDADLCAQLRDVKHRIIPAKYENLPGGWNRVASGPKNGDELDKQMKKLETLAYLSGSQSAPEGDTDVVHYDVGYTYDGYNLYNSADAPEAILLDMDGKIVHRWAKTVEEVWPDYEPEGDAWGHKCWRRVYLYPNGDLLAIFVGVGVIKVDKDSNLLWSHRAIAHHHLDVAPDGTIYILTRKARVIPEFNAKKPMLEEFVTVLDPDGNELRNISLLEAFQKTAFKPVIERMKKLSRLMGGYGDIFHTNTIKILDGTMSDKIPAFRAGNILLSLNYSEVICVLDPEKGTIEWVFSGGGMWCRQHEPQMLPTGNILIFDNGGDGGHSRVLEFDPLTNNVVWLYTGNEHRQFFSHCCGTCQRLPNGNTLITETEAGRAFEVTPDKLIVWEFVSPHRTGDENELVASLFDVHRIEFDYVSGWLTAE